MDYSRIKFLLKLLDCANHRTYVAGPALANFDNKEKICEELGADGLVDYTREISSMSIAPAGRALLNFATEQLPISDRELKVLEKIEKEPGIRPEHIFIYVKGKKMKAEERDKLFQSLYERGLITVESKCSREKAEVWLTKAGLECLEKVNTYFNSLRTVAPDGEREQPTPSLNKPSLEEILQTIEDLDREVGTNNYLPIFHLRDKLQPPLSREELDDALLSLQRNHKIDLISLQEETDYTSEQLEAAIHHSVGRRLFFIIVNKRKK